MADNVLDQLRRAIDGPECDCPVCAACAAAIIEIERLRALIIQWDAAFFGRPRVGDLPPEVSLYDAEFALQEEARRG